MEISQDALAGFYYGKNVIKSIALVVVIYMIKNTVAYFFNDIYFILYIQEISAILFWVVDDPISKMGC